MGTRITLPYVPFTDAGVEGGPEELCMLTPVKECNALIRAFFQYFRYDLYTSDAPLILTYYICLAGILYGRGVRFFFGHASAPGCAAEGWYAK